MPYVTALGDSQSSNLRVHQVDRANDFPRSVLTLLEKHPIKSNVILPTLLKCQSRERMGEIMRGHLWLIVYSGSHVIFVASCTEGYIGDYPLFFFSPHRYSELRRDNITDPLRLVVDALISRNLQSRIYSVFAPQIVTETFATIWTAMTGITLDPNPVYYKANISFMTQDNLSKDSRPAPVVGCETRLGVSGDIHDIARLCYGFAIESPPFVLDQKGAYQEARTLIEAGQVWVYTVPSPSGSKRIVSIVACTRNTTDMATITKVFTPPEDRGNGYAHRLVKFVCKHQFLNKRKFVALFVGVDNPAANVYQRVGFVGVGNNSVPTEGVDKWLELGFDHRKVVLGQW